MKPKPFISSEHSRREARLQKWEETVRRERIKELDELLQRHRGDKNYFPAMSAWRREKLDLIMQR